jgi:lipopolysaccharide export system protein LptC
MNLAQTLRSLHGNKVGAAIEELHRSENDLAGALLNLSDQQKVDHEVFYVARDIARWSQEHVRRLAEAGRGYGVDLDPEPEDEATLLAKVKQKGSELVGRFHEPSLLLLADLRHIHRTAAGVSLDWEVLAQTAQAMQDTELLALTKDCHPETLRQMRWANAKVKEAAAQVMVTG